MIEAAVARTSAPRVNNFDLIRLLAAAQVAFFHSANHLQLRPPMENPIVWIVRTVPGVPVFFVVSGFLISLSWERNPSLGDYWRNRALRIFPALWVCLAVSIALAVVVGGVSFFRLDAIPWLLAQLSFVQFYTPDFLRGYGVGSMNGSLWTIPVELQFYVLLPLLYRITRRREGVRDAVLVAVAAASIAVQLALVPLGVARPGSVVIKLVTLSVLPHLWMFLVGVLLQRSFARIAPWVVGKAAYWLALHLAVGWVVSKLGGSIGTNTPHPVAMTVTAIAIISCAFTAPRASHRILGDNDVSYGVYIYHAVVINVFVALGMVGTWTALLQVLAITGGLALASWWLVEKPSLRMKKKALKPV